jgi:hypothetical protein
MAAAESTGLMRQIGRSCGREEAPGSRTVTRRAGHARAAIRARKFFKYRLLSAFVDILFGDNL